MVDVSFADLEPDQPQDPSINQSKKQLSQSTSHYEDQSTIGSTDDSTSFDWLINDRIDELITQSLKQSVILPTPLSTRDRAGNEAINQFNFQPRIPSYIPIARNYAYNLSNKPVSYTDYLTRSINWSSSDPYSIVRLIGYGKFSDVFLAVKALNQPSQTASVTLSMEQLSIDQSRRQSFKQLISFPHSNEESDSDFESDFSDDEEIDQSINQLVAIKVLKPIDQAKIRREVHMLECLSFSSRVVQLIDCVHDHRSEMHSLVFEYLPETETNHLFQSSDSSNDQSSNQSNQSIQQSISLTINKSNVESYSRFVHIVHDLLLAVKDVHSAGIMHRDLKPGNLSINQSNNESGSIKLLDFGLSDFYFPHRAYPTRVASRYYKAPELLCDYYYYSFAVDMWAVGVIIAQWMTGCQLFTGDDTEDQMLQIVERRVGMKAFRAWADKYEVELSADMAQTMNSCKVDEPQSFDRWINQSNRHLCTPDVLDLLTKLLDIDHDTRLTVTEALQHPLFDQFSSPDLAVTQPNSAVATPQISPSSRWSC